MDNTHSFVTDPKLQGKAGEIPLSQDSEATESDAPYQSPHAPVDHQERHMHAKALPLKNSPWREERPTYEEDASPGEEQTVAGSIKSNTLQGRGPGEHEGPMAGRASSRDEIMKRTRRDKNAATEDNEIGKQPNAQCDPADVAVEERECVAHESDSESDAEDESDVDDCDDDGDDDYVDEFDNAKDKQEHHNKGDDESESETSLAEETHHPPVPLLGGVSPIVERSSRKHASSTLLPTQPPIPSANPLNTAKGNRAYFAAGPVPGMMPIGAGPASPYPELTPPQLPPQSFNPMPGADSGLASGHFMRHGSLHSQDSSHLRMGSSTMLPANQDPSQILHRPSPQSQRPPVGMVPIQQGSYYEGVPYQHPGIVYPGRHYMAPSQPSTIPNLNYDYGHPSDMRYRGLYVPPNMEPRIQPAAYEQVRSGNTLANADPSRKRRGRASHGERKLRRRLTEPQVVEDVPMKRTNYDDTESRDNPRFERASTGILRRITEKSSTGKDRADDNDAAHSYSTPGPSNTIQGEQRLPHRISPNPQGDPLSSSGRPLLSGENENEQSSDMPSEGSETWPERYKRHEQHYDAQTHHPVQHMPMHSPHISSYRLPFQTTLEKSIPGHVQHARPGQRMQAKLEIVGDLNDMTLNWTAEELKRKRRLVLFHRHQEGVVIRLTFEALEQEKYADGMTTISCILWEETEQYFLTSVDCISILELIVGQRFDIEEKNRTRRNLEVCKPVTVSKNRPDLEPFFRQIMAYDSPRPRNIEKDLKVFAWNNLENALKKIISKYSAIPPRGLGS